MCIFSCIPLCCFNRTTYRIRSPISVLVLVFSAGQNWSFSVQVFDIRLQAFFNYAVKDAWGRIQILSSNKAEARTKLKRSQLIAKLVGSTLFNSIFLF